jgi:hypothetical protein
MTTKQYSAKSTAIFLLFSVAILSLFGFLTTNPNFLKGQLGSSSGPAISLEIANCGVEDCSNPSLIVNSLTEISGMELLVKRAADGKVAYADYLDAVPANNRYEVAFSADICGNYSYDAITSRYNQDLVAECTASLYDFIVSGATSDSSSPLFIQSTTFTLTK